MTAHKSIMHHNFTIWCHMVIILALFDSHRDKLSTNSLMLYYMHLIGQIFIACFTCVLSEVQKIAVCSAGPYVIH